MADGGGRTAEEREAARLERERRRAGQGGAASPGPSARPGTAATAAASSTPALPTRRPRRPAPVDPPDDDGDETGGARARDSPRAPGGSAIARGSSHARPDSPARPAAGPRPDHGSQTGAGLTAAGPRTRPSPVGRRRWFGRLASLVALVLAAVLIWFLIELFQPFGTSPHGEVTVIVPAKSTSSQIGDLLARDGVISSSFFFEVRATLAGERSSLRSGVYHLQKGMSYGAVLTKLTTAPPAAKVTELTVAEGRRRAQISALLHEQHIKGNYLAATRRTHAAQLPGLRAAPPAAGPRGLPVPRHLPADRPDPDLRPGHRPAHHLQAAVRQRRSALRRAQAPHPV